MIPFELFWVMCPGLFLWGWPPVLPPLRPPRLWGSDWGQPAQDDLLPGEPGGSEVQIGDNQHRMTCFQVSLVVVRFRLGTTSTGWPASRWAWWWCGPGTSFSFCNLSYSPLKWAEGNIYPKFHNPSTGAQDGCGKEFSASLLQQVLRPRLWQRLLQRRQAEEVTAAG